MCSKTLAWYRSPQWQCRLECIQCGASDHTFSEGIPGNNCLGEEGTFKIVSPALVCVESLDKLAPWFFAFDQINYARWLPVNMRDLNMLAHVHPELHQEFQAGNFVIHKTPNVSSGMSIDQAHEQNNDMVKGSGGAVGLTESPSVFTRWMVAGPQGR